MLPQDSVAQVFGGTVARVDRRGSAETVIFDVDQVWKGDVRERTAIYKPIALAGGSGTPTVFERGERYVVIAHRLSVAERQDLGLVSGEAFGTNVCGDGSRRFSVVEQDGYGCVRTKQPEYSAQEHTLKTLALVIGTIEPPEPLEPHAVRRLVQQPRHGDEVTPYHCQTGDGAPGHEHGKDDPDGDVKEKRSRREDGEAEAVLPRHGTQLSILRERQSVQALAVRNRIERRAKTL
jgi:hypothetical protein